MPFLNLSKHAFCQQAADVLLKRCDKDAEVDGENNSERYESFIYHRNGRMYIIRFENMCTKLAICDNRVYSTREGKLNIKFL